MGRALSPDWKPPPLTRVQLGPLGPAEAAALGAPERACAGCVDGAKSLLMDLTGPSAIRAQREAGVGAAQRPCPRVSGPPEVAL